MQTYLYGRGMNLFGIAIALGSAATLLVASRILSRFKVGSALVLSDWAIVLSLLCSLGADTGAILTVAYGFGKHASQISQASLVTAVKAFYSVQITYKVSINLTKLSICLLYLQIFPGRTFRAITAGVMIYIGTYAITSIIVTVLQCLPIRKTWDHQVEGKCISLEGFWYAGAAFNMLGDIAVLVLPIPSTLKLEIPVRQKVGLVFVFLLGGFVCITSILRMTTLGFGARATDQPYGTLDSEIWTVIEMNFGIMCACLPMLKAPLSALCPRIFGTGNARLSGKGNTDSVTRRYHASCEPATEDRKALTPRDPVSPRAAKYARIAAKGDGKDDGFELAGFV